MKEIKAQLIEEALNDPTPVMTLDEEIEAFLDTLDWTGIEI